MFIFGSVNDLGAFQFYGSVIIRHSCNAEKEREGKMESQFEFFNYL